MFARLSRFVLVGVIALLLFIIGDETVASAQTAYICGYSTSGVLQSGMTGYPYPYIIACSTGETIKWGNLGSWGLGIYVRITNPMIVEITPVQLNDGTAISKEVRSWSDYFEVSDCNVCSQDQPVFIYPSNSYFDDFSTYPVGSVPSGWTQYGTSAIVPTVVNFGDTGPTFQRLDFPAYIAQSTGKWLIKDGFTWAAVTASVKVNFQTGSDGAGLVLAWVDNNNFIAVLPNPFWDEIVVWEYANGQIRSAQGTGRYAVPIQTNQDYWLKAMTKISPTGDRQVDVWWSTDGSNYTLKLTATGLANLTGQAGVGTYQFLSHTLFDDLSLTGEVVVSTPTSLPRTATRVPPNATPTPTPRGPKLVITNFALTEAALTQDTLAASHFTTYVLKRNTLWVEITNTGDAPFIAPSGGGQYTLQVIVKQPGGKIEEQEFISTSFSPEPLGSLAPGDRQMLMVTDLFFWVPVKNAELEVFLKPDGSLRLSNSILSKGIAIKNHPDSYLNCMATLSQAVFKVNAIRTGKAVWSLASLGSAVVKEVSKGNIKGALSEMVRWFLDQLLQYGLHDAGELFSAGLDAAFEMGNRDIPCLKVSDFINAFLHQMLLRGYKSGGVITQSPVYPLVINVAGQRTGFLEDGQIVQEIPNSQVSQIGESRIILFAGEDVSDIQVRGYSEGSMNFYVTLPQDGEAHGYTLSYENTQVTEGMMATLNLGDRERKLVVDTNGDGEGDLWYLPTGAEQVTVEGNVVELPLPAITPISSPQPATATAPQPVQRPGTCGGAIGLAVFPLLLLALRQRRPHS